MRLNKKFVVLRLGSHTFFEIKLYKLTLFFHNYIQYYLKSIYHALVVIYKLKFSKYFIENLAFFKSCNSLALEKFPGQSKLQNQNNLCRKHLDDDLF